MKELPHLAADLIEELDKIYPALTSHQVLTMDREDLIAKAAKRSVVEVLITKQQKESKARRA